MSIGFPRYGWRAAWGVLAAWVVLGCMPARAADDMGTCFTLLVAAIDIGHSRSSPGAKDVLGRDELDYNVELVATIEDQLVRSGIGRVVLINRNLDTASLPERPQRAFCAGADLFISVHHDNVVDSLKMGVVDEQGRILIEAGFLSNRNDMRRLQSAEYRLRIARGVVEGLKAMCVKHPGLAGLNKTAGNRRLGCG